MFQLLNIQTNLAKQRNVAHLKFKKKLKVKTHAYDVLINLGIYLLIFSLRKKK